MYEISTLMEGRESKWGCAYSAVILRAGRTEILQLSSAGNEVFKASDIKSGRNYAFHHGNKRRVLSLRPRQPWELLK